MSQKKLIAAYVLLVGVPLLGLLGILRSGRHLAAPASVGGTWNLESDLSPIAGSGCKQAFANINQPFFGISQSGSLLTFTLNNPEQTSLSGTIRENTVIMGDESSTGNASADCAHPQALHFQAALSQQGLQRALTGTLSIAGCQDCPTLPFRAVRQSSPAKGGQ